MAIYAFYLIAFSPKFAGCHPGDMSQSLQLIFVRFIEMIVGAVIPKKTIMSQKVNIAHLKLFDPLHFISIEFDYRINTLAVTVSRDCLSGCRGRLRRRGR